MAAIVAAIFFLAARAAYPFNFGGDGTEFGHLGASVGAGTAAPPLTACGTGVIDMSTGCTILLQLGLVP